MTQMIDLRRRGLLRGSGITVLSASAVALLAGCEKMAVAQSGSSSGNGSTANDVGILNTALALENEAISAYQLGAQSGLLQKPVLEVAVLFQTHHIIGDATSTACPSLPLPPVTTTRVTSVAPPAT